VGGARPGRRLLPVLGTAALVLAATSAPAQQSAEAAGVGGTDGRDDLQEIARQIRHPASPLWQVTFDHSVEGLARGGLPGVRTAYTGTLLPQFPIGLERLGLGRFPWAEDFQLVTRLTVPFVASVPLPPGPGSDRETGFGDIQLGSVLTPRKLTGWIGGIGPTFVFPSASDDALGQGKWQAGPAAVGGYMGDALSAYAVAQQWWSFAGDDALPRTSQLCVNYVLLASLGEGWQVGMQPTFDVDWEAPAGDRVTFPVGLGVGKTFRLGKLPVQIWVEADYYAVRPERASGPRWGIDVQFVPVFPGLF
jgi:hypothetical protein